MATVFESRAYQEGPDPRAQILRALAKGEWRSTSDLYGATNRVVPRVKLHALLKALLAQRLIRMRLVRGARGRHRTEFRLETPTEKGKRTPEARSAVGGPLDPPVAPL